jgi:hypothetical protein
MMTTAETGETGAAIEQSRAGGRIGEADITMGDE